MKIKFIILTLFSTIVLNAQNNNSFSLDQAINFALENNRTVKNAIRDIDAAKKRKWETTTMGLPQINASIDYKNWIKQQISLIPAEFFGGMQGQFAEVSFGTKQTMSANATISQLLFDGSYLVGLQSAKVYLEISKNAKEKTDLEIRKTVVNAYGNVLLIEENIKIVKRNIGILKKNIFETTQIFKNGLTEEESVEQLQITLSNLENNLKNINRLKSIAYKMLNLTLGLDVETTTKLTDNLEGLTTKNTVLTLLDSKQNVENTIDYKIAANSKHAKELLLKLEKSKALPRLNAFINGAYNGNSETFSFTQKDQKWFGSSLFGVSMNIPIFSSGLRSAATQRAKINLEKEIDNLTETEQQLKLQIASAKSNYQFAIEDYQNKKENLNLAERIEKKNQIKFFEGISSSFELRQAQLQLYSAQQQYLQAMLNVLTKKVELETVLNTTSN